jgi:hypothetical protein
LRNFKHGWIIKGGQKHVTTYYEKGSRNKNREAQKSSQVGHPHNVRKQNAAARAQQTPPRFNAINDEALPIPPNQSWIV